MHGDRLLHLSIRRKPAWWCQVRITEEGRSHTLCDLRNFQTQNGGAMKTRIHLMGVVDIYLRENYPVL